MAGISDTGTAGVPDARRESGRGVDENVPEKFGKMDVGEGKPAAVPPVPSERLSKHVKLT